MELMKVYLEEWPWLRELFASFPAAALLWTTAAAMFFGEISPWLGLLLIVWFGYRFWIHTNLIIEAAHRTRHTRTDCDCHRH